MVTPALGMAQAQEVDGYWERVGKVDIEKAPQPLNSTTTTTYTISSSSGTYRANLNGETFQASMTWTEPSQRYAGGESIDLTINVKIDEYIWNDDVPGYLNEGLNYMGATISTRIDEPDISYGGVTRGAISLTDLQGEYSAKVSTDYGKIVVESQTLQVSAPFPSGGSDGDKKSIYVSCTAGMIRYNYQWVENASEEMEAPLVIPPEDSNQEPESEPTSGAPLGGVLGQIIVVVGIAIAGTLSTIAVELANKAAQAATSDKEEQPAEETVYVLNPSHKQFNLEVNKPVTLTVNAYRVTKEGHQIEKDAHISLSLLPDLGEYFNIQTTTSTGQLTAIITLLKIPSASSVILDVNGVFPHGKAKAEVQLAFKMDFTISSVRSPKITYYEKDKQWRAPELVACFREPVQNTPIKVGFYYGFMDPPLTFEPDILEVKESYSSDDGLTYNFKLNVKDDINLETFFGKDLTGDDGRINVNVVVKDEKGKEFTAKTELQVSPQLKMIAYSYNKNVKTRGQRATPYKGLELEEMEFIADGIDKLPLVIFFIRSDKEVTKGSEAEAMMDIVDVQKIDWITNTSYEEPEVNAANTGDGFFAFDLSSSGLIAADKDTVNGEYWLEVDARIRAGGPKNYSIEGNSLRFAVKPQFTLLRLWVVPGYKRSTSDAIAYAKLLPCQKPFTGLKLTLETSGGGGAVLNMSDGHEKVTQIKDSPTDGVGILFKMVKGTARWVLTYSWLTWNNLPQAQFQVTCQGPRDKFGECVTASDSFDVNANVLNMLSDLLSDSDIQARLNNPYHFKENDAIPEFLNGPIWNCYQWFDTNKPYVCHQMRSGIVDFLHQRRHYCIDGDLKMRLDSMRGMNGIEYENYYMYAIHVWAGFFLSGNSSGDYKALDPWWEQRWVDPSFNKPENLMTTADEVVNVTKLAASLGVVAATASTLIGTVGAGIAAGGAAAGGAATMLIVLNSLLLGMKISAALQAAGLTNIAVSSAFDYGSVADPNDQTVEGFQKTWLIEFIQRLNQKDLNEWRKS